LSLLLTKCYSGSQVKNNATCGAWARMGERRGVHGFMVRARGKHRRRLEDNIKFVLQGIGWDVNWINLPQDGDKVPRFCERGNETPLT
jgi:hypothetical protein